MVIYSDQGGQVRFFRLLQKGVPIESFVSELRQHEDAWLVDTSRQEMVEAQRDTNTIFLRGAVRRFDLHINENQECRQTRMAALFPAVMAFIETFSAEMDASPSRATLVRLKPHSRVTKHIDEGSYYFIRDRYHLVLVSSAGSPIMSGGELVRMMPGELWWFDNKQHHDASNDSVEWRVHLIFDLLPNRYKHLARNPELPADDITSAGQDGRPGQSLKEETM
jgi:hypothetical protein